MEVIFNPSYNFVFISNVSVVFSSLNEHAVIVTNLKDTLVNATNICECDIKSYISEQPPKIAKTLEAKKKLESKNSATWYPLARDDMAQLVYQVSFSFNWLNDLHLALSSILQLILFVYFC